MRYLSNIFTQKTVHVLLALSVSGAMMFLAYFLSGPNFLTTPRANAEDVRKLLEAYAAKDTDNDKLPDWQEALYGTNPENAHSVDTALTDSEAVAKGLVKPKFESAPVEETTVDLSSLEGVEAAPATLTDQFARELFTQYMQSAGSTQATPEQVADFVGTAVSELSKEYVTSGNYRVSDVVVRGSGSVSLLSYAAAAEQVFFGNLPANPKDETSYFYEAVTNKNTTALKEVAKIGSWYETTAKALLKVPVPQEMGKTHLRLVNALATMGTVVKDMALLSSDPLRSLLGVGQYEDARKELLGALQETYSVFLAANVSRAEGEAGYRFFTMVKDWSTRQP